jgi:hypothetical protein
MADRGAVLTRWLPRLLAALVLAAAAGAQPGGNQADLKLYTEEEISQTPIAAFFDRLATPEPGYRTVAARVALIRKAVMGDPQTREEILQTAARYAEDPRRPIPARSSACYLLSGIEDDRVVPFLAGLLAGDPAPGIRSVAATALGSIRLPEARDALQQAAAREPTDTVREWIGKALARLEKAEADLPQNQVRFFLVKDWMRIKNTGGALEEVEFQRYFPVVDEEQIVLGRWISAQTDAGQPLAVSLVRVAPDSGGNLIHAYRMDRFPAGEEVVVTVTSILARHERRPPKGPYPILAPEAYPSDVQPYLQVTPMVAADHPEVVALAKQLRAESSDALEVATALCKHLHALTYQPTSSNWMKDRASGVPIAAIVLRYGHVCCPSADCAAAVLRACGIPTQLTYIPNGEIHGIVQLYLNGYGWYRIESTCGCAHVPKYGYGAPCVFNTPIKMESYSQAYLWPYLSSQESGRYEFRAEGEVCPALRYTVAKGADGSIIYYPSPFRHVESGDGHVRLASEPFAAPWQNWPALAEASRAAILDGTLGPFQAVLARVPQAAQYIQQGLTYQAPPAAE